MRKILLVALACLALTACGKEKVYTVDEMTSDHEILVTVLKGCYNNPGELEKGPNCQNARAALRTMSLNQSGPILERAKAR